MVLSKSKQIHAAIASLGMNNGMYMNENDKIYSTLINEVSPNNGNPLFLGVKNPFKEEHELSALQNNLLKRYAGIDGTLMRTVINLLFQGVNSAQPKDAENALAENCARLREEPTFAPLVNKLFQESNPHQNKAHPSQAAKEFILPGMPNSPAVQHQQLHQALTSGSLNNLKSHCSEVPDHSPIDKQAITTTQQAKPTHAEKATDKSFNSHSDLIQSIRDVEHPPSLAAHQIKAPVR